MKPILFNTEMVRAILSGKKTQTRRLPSSRIRDAWHDWYEYQCAVAPPGSRLETEEGFYKKHPPYKEGDILYVRETWKQATVGTAGPGLIDLYLYKAEEPQDTTGMMVEDRWHPSIHMPKEAARIWLKVTNVRCERLQDMDEDDAYYEGFRGCPHELALYFKDGSAEPCHVSGEGCTCDYWYCNHSPQEGFGRDIWDKTIKPDDLPHYGWDANPWVWVIHFEVVSR